MDTKPDDCTCAYPTAIARNMCGHAVGCPVYQRWAQRLLTPPTYDIEATLQFTIHVRLDQYAIQDADPRAAIRALLEAQVKTFTISFQAGADMTVIPEQGVVTDVHIHPHHEE